MTPFKECVCGLKGLNQLLKLSQIVPEIVPYSVRRIIKIWEELLILLPAFRHLRTLEKA